MWKVLCESYLAKGFSFSHKPLLMFRASIVYMNIHQYEYTSTGSEANVDSFTTKVAVFLANDIAFYCNIQ